MKGKWVEIIGEVSQSQRIIRNFLNFFNNLYKFLFFAKMNFIFINPLMQHRK